ncbi:MAG: hypothetical protein IV100_31245 [Myxococcales bacterium]|nr:hypothetical protein [Myxococcales bacterium]
MWEIVKIVIYGAVVLVLVPYTLIALAGIGVGMFRQFGPGEKRGAGGAPRNDAERGS